MAEVLPQKAGLHEVWYWAPGDDFQELSQLLLLCSEKGVKGVGSPGQEETRREPAHLGRLGWGSCLGPEGSIHEWWLC